MKVGDKVYIIKDEADDGLDVGKFGVIERIDAMDGRVLYQILVDGYAKTTGWFEDSFITEEIYNSPLWKALNED